MSNSLIRRIRKLKRLCRRGKRVLREARVVNYYYRLNIDEKLVLLESKHGEVVADNIFYIMKELNENYPEYKLCLSVKKDHVEATQTLLNAYGMFHVKIVRHNTPAYFKVLARAKFLFNDTAFLASFLKKEGQIYTNTWHGTPIKCLGDDAGNRKYASGNIKRNFMMSDYLLYPSAEVRERLTTAFGLPGLFPGKILNCGYPRNTIFFDRNQEALTREKLSLIGKRVSVYMPTWRGDITKLRESTQPQDATAHLKEIEAGLTEDDVFYVRMHPFIKEEVDLSSFKRVRAFPEGIEPYEVLNTADVLISDYSSVFFDFANTGKKIVLFTYDRADYMAVTNMYYSLDDLPFPKVETVQGLLHEIASPKEYDDAAFLKKFCTYDSPESVQQLVKLLVEGEEASTIAADYLEGNGRPNTLMYVATLPLNGLTSSALSLLSIIDMSSENIYFCFRGTHMAKFPERLEKLPPDAKVFPITGGFKYSLLELISGVLYFKFDKNPPFVQKYLDRMFTREGQRFFGGACFDRVIHFTGYERWIIGLFQRMDTQRAIFVHNDMVSEIEKKGNQHYLNLRDAYRSYDRVVPVTEAMIKPTVQISGREDNVVVIENAHDAQKVINRSTEPLSFEEKTESTMDLDHLSDLLKSDALIFGNIGRFSPEKGQVRLMNAFNDFRKEVEDAYLIIIGGYGAYYKNILEHREGLASKDNIIVIKSINNPFPVLKRCDLFILSSFYESLGLVLLEAATLNVPCFSTDIPGTSEFMREHGGLVVQDSEDGIFQGMKDFAAGKVTAMNFDIVAYNERIKQQYENLFADIDTTSNHAVKGQFTERGQTS